MKITIDQGSAEWHELRIKHPRTASRTPAIMGKSPWQTADDVFRAINGQEQKSNYAMQRGTDLEPIARQIIEAKTGGLFVPEVHVQGDYLASLDGIDGDTLLEIKCPLKGKASATWLEAANGIIPDHYALQVQHQLAVSGASLALFAVFDGDSEVMIVETRQDNAVWGSIQAAWDEFFDKVREGYQPQEKTDYIRITSAEWADCAEEYRAAQAIKECAEQRMEAAKTQLIAMMQGDKCQGAGVSVYKSIRAGSIDYKTAIAKIAPDADLEPYRKKESEIITVRAA